MEDQQREKLRSLWVSVDNDSYHTDHGELAWSLHHRLQQLIEVLLDEAR